MESIPIKTIFLTKLRKFYQYQGVLNDCGAFVTAITLNTLLGTHLDGFELGEHLNQTRWYGPFPMIRRIRNWATFPWGITTFFREFGVNAKWSVFNRGATLKSNLINNKISIVIIGEWKPLWSHYMILVEYSPIKGYGFIDPAQNSSQTRWESPKEFLPLWNNYLRSVISITPPKTTLIDN